MHPVPDYPDIDPDYPKRFSIEAEQSLLGALLQNSELFADLPPELNPHDFSLRHGKIFKAMGELHNDNTAIDIISVAEKIGDLDYLTDIVQNVPAHQVGNTLAYAKLILTYSQKRNIERIALRMQQLAYDDMDAQEKINLINTELQTLEHTTCEEEGENVNGILKRVVEGIDHRFRGGEIPGLKTGYKDLDEKILAMQPGQFIVVAGRPSMGKTTLAMNIVRRVLSQNKNVLVFSFETTKEKIIERMLAEAGKINLQRIRTGKLDDDDWPKLETAARMLKDKNLTVIDVSGLHINRASAIARKINRRKKIDLIAFDYLQLMKGDGENETIRLGSVSVGLKALAKQIDCPVIGIAQLNRASEKQSNKRPHNGDIRQCGQVEQDADIIAMIYRDEYYNEDSDQKGVAEVIVTKNKDGETGTVRLASKLHYNAFEDLENYTPPEPQKSMRDFYS